MESKIIADLENKVFCDLCNTDFTGKKDSGGFVFSSKGVCPLCAPEFMENIEKYHEENYINAVCPKGVSFQEFIINYRGGNSQVVIHTFEKGEKIFWK